MSPEDAPVNSNRNRDGANRSSLTRWCQRMGEQRLVALIQESLAVASRTGAAKPADFSKVIVDTTVQPKAVAFPTDAKLMHRARERLAKLARKSVLDLRQPYARVGKHALIAHQRYAQGAARQPLRRSHARRRDPGDRDPDRRQPRPHRRRPRLSRPQRPARSQVQGLYLGPETSRHRDYQTRTPPPLGGRTGHRTRQVRASHGPKLPRWRNGPASSFWPRKARRTRTSACASRQPPTRWANGAAGSPSMPRWPPRRASPRRAAPDRR